MSITPRAAAPARRAILDDYLAALPFPQGARVLEIGCGSGPVTRVLAGRLGGAAAVGIDPSAGFIARARALGAGHPNLAFLRGDGHAPPFGDATFDAVVFHTMLLHLADPPRALAAAQRLLRPGGYLSVLDPDVQATSFAVADHDPLQAMYTAAIPGSFRHPWLARRLPGLLGAAGFAVERVRNYGTIETRDEAGALAFVDASADAAADAVGFGAELAAAFKAEARRRLAAGTFVREGSSISVIARKAA